MQYRIKFIWLCSLVILGLSTNLVFQSCKKDNAETIPTAALTAKELAKDRDFMALAVLVQDRVAKSPFLSRHYDREQKKAMSLQIKQIVEAENQQKGKMPSDMMAKIAELQGFQSVEAMKKADADLWALRAKVFSKYPALKQPRADILQEILREAFVRTGALHRYLLVADKVSQNYFLIDHSEKSSFQHLLPAQSRCYPNPCIDMDIATQYSCCDEARYRFEDANARCNEAFYLATIDCPDAPPIDEEEPDYCVSNAVFNFAVCANMAYDRYIYDTQNCDSICQ